ncbi:M12 family metallo-peptidase [Engelhardtia mirabilis]|uniref:Lectin C-type domain protein n=1 Tax=Engelhardtia mirabilis TaxID=2528011 RepID=A0A518BRE8_9BACT|nr:Lectin C-type domain protein [Planctomycetes bacterium Pla133]QDV03872.1 Lectin C-type domain protein [Planctomycetes bacterium Pla86]
MLLASALLGAATGLGWSAPDAPSVTWPLVPTTDGQLTADRASLSVLDGLLDVRIEDAMVPGMEGRALLLERVPAATSDALLFVDGEPVAPLGASLRGDLSLWRGTVEGDPQSDVYLALSSVGARGWVRSNGQLVHLLATPDVDRGWSASRSRWVTDAAIRHLAPPPSCEMLELPEHPAPVTAPATPRLLPIGAGGQDELYQCRMAVETDWDFYQLFGDLVAAEAYALSLFGAVSDTYVDQVGTLVHVAYLGLYTTSSDPWNTPDIGGGSGDMLNEFRSAWIGGWPVDADLAHLISGAGLGGGVAWVGVLGYHDYAYAVSGNLAGQTPFPVAQGPLNWDFVVTAHETGHNFGTSHTHNYCPPLDQCAPDGYWGQCQTTTLCAPGTIMSYCHLCDGGIANIAPVFHPTVKQVIRDSVVSSALRPYEGLSQTDLGAQLASGSHAPTASASYDGQTNGLVIDFADVPSPQTGVLVVGASIGNLPLFGGTLVPSPDLLSVFATTGASAAFGPATLTGSYPFGIELIVQGWFTDPGGVEGLAASNALSLELIKPVPPSAVTWAQHPSNGFEYAIGEPATWFHSQSLAQQFGGTLASIPSASLESWLVTNLFAGAGPNEDLWIGYTDALSEGAWHWIDGSGVSAFTPWTANEPNDYNGSEDYAEWWQAGAGWNDGNGFDVQRAVYQRAIGTQP